MTQPASAAATWIGHGTVLVDMDGTRVITDPVLRRRLMHLRRVGGVSDRALRGIDAILISHLHYDHLDLPSLDRLGSALPIVVPRGAGSLVRKRGFRRVDEVAPGDELEIGAIGLRVVEADHDGGRGPLGPKGPALGFVLTGTRSIYYAGDTDLFDAMAGLVPGLDLALLPIWGWGPTIGPGHMNPERAAEAARRLAPRIAVPVHWGTLYPVTSRAAGRGFLQAPAKEFAAAAARIAPDVEARVLQPGETLVLAEAEAGGAGLDEGRGSER